MRSIFRVLLVLGLFVCAAARAHAGSAKAYNIRMRRTDMPDTTDIPSILDTILTPGMTDAQKAMAIWRTVVKYRQQDEPPTECITMMEPEAVKVFNVYGYSMCGGAASFVEALGEGAGLPGRILAITGHNVSELEYGGQWHLLDASLINFFVWDNGILASVDEICNNQAALINQDHCPTAIYYGSDWYPAGTHRLSNAMTEYGSGWAFAGDGFYSGHTVGYRCLLTLREGETLVRSCANTGQVHVNKDGSGNPPGCISKFAGQGGPDTEYMIWPIPGPRNAGHCYFHPSYKGGIVGNGTLSYEPDLAGGGYRRGMEGETNIACTADDGNSPAVHLAASGSGSLVVRMQSPYIFLDGSVEATFTRGDASDTVKVSISTNNMLDWQEIYAASATGTFSANIATESYVYRRYSYHLKFELSSSVSETSVGIDSLRITNLVQHHQRAMPFLVQGDNEIVVDSGGAASTVTVNPRVTTAAVSPAFTKNETLTTMHAAINNMTVADGYLWSNGAGDSVTFPVSAPGDITALRFGGCFRIRDAGNYMDWEISTTGPTSGFAKVDDVRGPSAKISKYITYTSLPPGTRDLWVRFRSSAISNAVGIMGHVRIDADYTEPGATRLTFKIKHEWTESGQPKSHTEHVAGVPHTYHVQCSQEPTMTALSVWAEDSEIKASGGGGGGCGGCGSTAGPGSCLASVCLAALFLASIERLRAGRKAG